jgi:hypothetical protein
MMKFVPIYLFILSLLGESLFSSCSEGILSPTRDQTRSCNYSGWSKPTSPRIYYINMASSGDRRRIIEQRLAAIGAKSTRIDALTMETIHIPADLLRRKYWASERNPNHLQFREVWNGNCPLKTKVRALIPVRLFIEPSPHPTPFFPSHPFFCLFSPFLIATQLDASSYSS